MEPTESAHAGRGPMGTPELFDAWCRHHDDSARAELIRRHLPLARRLAGRYARSGEGLDDLVQVASVGLINAVERFDPDRGAAFSSFAVPTILGELKRHFRDSGWAVRLDRRTQERATAVTAAERELSSDGHPPSVADLARHLHCEEEDVLDALEATGARRAVSLDAPTRSVGDEPAAVLADTMGADDLALEAVPTRADLGSAVRHLPRLERKIIYLRFDQDLSQREIAARVGVSQMHVSRLLRRSLGVLRGLIDDPLAPAHRHDGVPGGPTLQSAGR